MFKKQQTNQFEGFTSSIQADETALIRYKLALDDGIPENEAFMATLANASEKAREFAQNTDISGASLVAFSNEQLKSNVSIIASNKSLSTARGLIDEYNTGCVNCGLSQSEFATTVGGSNRILGNYLSGLNGAEASMGGYILSLAGAKLATFGLRVATMALNAALTMGISMLVSGAISAISDWIHEEEKARDKSIELGEQAVETSKNLFQLATKYIEVSKAVKSGTASPCLFTLCNAYAQIKCQLAGLWTAACDAGWSQSCAVFGLPFDTDTWNSFTRHPLAAKRSSTGFYLFCYFRVTIQIVNYCGESSLLCHSLTLAPHCPVLRFAPAARVNSPPRARVGTNRLTLRG